MVVLGFKVYVFCPKLWYKALKVCYISFFITMHLIVGFHFGLFFFVVFASVFIFKCICLIASFVYYQIHLVNSNFIFFTMSIIAMKEGRVITVVDYLYFGIKDVAFEINVFNMYGTFDQIVNDHGKSKLHIWHYDLLNRACLTTITLNVKSPHIECMNNFYTRACM